MAASTAVQATVNAPAAPTTSTFDDSMAAAEAFRAVKSLVTTWSVCTPAKRLCLTLHGLMWAAWA